MTTKPGSRGIKYDQARNHTSRTDDSIKNSNEHFSKREREPNQSERQTDEEEESKDGPSKRKKESLDDKGAPDKHTCARVTQLRKERTRKKGSEQDQTCAK